ncbi:MobC family plasmid mobilization relaxosome protein [Trueperella sp. LYQ143]|uniref:MobC family plasmid mobilization relaxosome protein n=1 Tax=Trueperella sp. LYQ143 TaxID=3391059 RepID=UPI003983CB61
MSANRERIVRKQMYFSAVEWAGIVRRMRTIGSRNFSQFARDALLSVNIIVSHKEANNRALISALGRIGNNLNQIARQVNTDQVVTLSIVHRCLELMEEIYQLIREDMEERSGYGQGLETDPSEPTRSG